MRHPEKAHRPDNPIQRKPAWIRVKAPTHPVYHETRALMRANGLVTVCEEAACPNIGECWSQRHATMMIMGDTCTRACAFCNVATGQPGPLAVDEPARVADAVAKLGLAHVVVTSVDRDDLPDGGAGHFAATIRAIRAAAPATTIEVLTPDFLRKPGAVEVVVEARPDVYNHNLETVPRLYPTIRPGARYFASLQLLHQVKQLDPSIFTKSGLMVGLGESRIEIMQVMDDLRSAEVDFLTIGQYLQPTIKHAAVDRFVTPEEFAEYAALARGKGFLLVSATPLTRSSYHADADFACAARGPRGSRLRGDDDTTDAHPRRAPDRSVPARPALRSGGRRRQVSAVPALVRRRAGAQPHRARTGRRPHHRLRPVSRNLHQPRHPRSATPGESALRKRPVPLPEQPVGVPRPTRRAARWTSSSTSNSAAASCRRRSASCSTRRSAAWSAPSTSGRAQVYGPPVVADAPPSPVRS